MFKPYMYEFLTAFFSSVLSAVVGYVLFGLSGRESIALFLFLVVLFSVVLYIYKTHLSPLTRAKTLSEETLRELKARYEEVNTEVRKLREEKQGTEMFLASMSHEIRTPLNGIVGLTDLLDETALNGEQKEFVTMIRESSNNLRVIVNDILDVSKINAGKLELENIPFDLFAKIETSTGMFIAKMEEKNIVFNLFTDPRIPSMVIGDPTRLSQVIINLVSNAVKFTPEDGRIDVWAEYIRSNDDQVTCKISVRDSGIGLTEEQQNRIFEAYSQAEVSTTREAGGTGLGLTISSRIIESMGGTLQVTSKKGQGADFHFTLSYRVPKEIEDTQDRFKGSRVGILHFTDNRGSLWMRIAEGYFSHLGVITEPLKRGMLSDNMAIDLLLVEHRGIDQSMLEQIGDLSCKKVLLSTASLKHHDQSDIQTYFDMIVYFPVTYANTVEMLTLCRNEKAREKQSKEASPVITLKQFENLHVLVAEDNPINQKLIKIVLENFGLDVMIVSNGKEAVEARQVYQFDMIFMDVQMPVMSGVEATRAILSYEKEKGVSHTPIIALTANALSGDREKYIAEGMDDYATKPLEVNAIRGLIETYCRAGS